MLLLSLKDNITLTVLSNFTKFGFVNKSLKNLTADTYIKKLNIKPPIANRKIKSFSGGNQQKAVLAKWLAINPKILILDEPTRGVDVGAKQEIYFIINELVDQGISIILVSSEMQEILGLCDRIIVMHEGRISGEFANQEVSQELLMKASIKLKKF